MRLKLFFIAIFIPFCLSCSDSPLNISQIKSIAEIDYGGNKSPQLKLCVFLSTESDIRAASDIKIISEDYDLEWVCDNPSRFTDEEEQNWVGCISFYPADGETMPKGNYSLIYEDASGKTCESEFCVDYPDDLLTTSTTGFLEIVPDSFERKLAVYSEDDVLLYFGDEKDYLTNKSSLMNDCEGAFYFKLCYISDAESIICLMPAEQLE